MPNQGILIIERRIKVTHILKSCYGLGTVLSHVHALFSLIFVTHHQVDPSLSSIS